MLDVKSPVKESPILGLMGMGGGIRFATGPSGYTIDQSLAFANEQWLRRASTPAVGETWTISYWVKLGEVLNLSNNSDCYYFKFGTSSSKVNLYTDNYNSNTSQNGVFKNDVADFSMNGRYRDYNAWYHVVWSNDGSTSIMWVNGKQRSSSTTTFDIGAGNFTIGAATGTTSSSTSSNFRGYQAEWYFIDGQTLTPESFGEYSDNGIWLPKEYTGTYGDEGFHLTFDSSQTNGIGHDSSGNGNHFSEGGSNFSSAQEDILDTPTQNWANMTPDGSVEMESAFFISDALNTITVTNNSGYRNCTSNVSPEGTKGYFEITLTSGTPNFFFGFVDASIVPTTNSTYSTTGNVHALRENGAVVTASTTIRASYTSSFSSSDVIGVAYDFTGSNRNVWFSRNGTFGTTASGAGNPATGANPVLTTTQLTTPQNIFLATNTGGGSQVVTVNFGQSDFAHTPPSGFAALQVSKSPAPTIKKGESHFKAMAGGGSNPTSIGANQVNVGGYTNPVGYLDMSGQYHPSNAFNGNTTDFTFVPRQNASWPEFIIFDTPKTGSTIEIWASIGQGGMYVNGTFRSGNSSGAWLDISSDVPATGLKSVGFKGTTSGQDGFAAIRIDGDVLVDLAILQKAQQTFSNGLWWVKDYENGSTQHQLVDIVRGTNTAFPNPSEGTETTYSAPSGSSVAWCWNAGSSFTPSQTGGLTNLSGRSNTTAGFSIITYTGSGSNSTFGHGLTAAPEFYMVRKRSGGPCCVYHKTSGAGKILVLNTNAADSNASTYWNNSAPTTSIINLGTATDVNDGSNFVCYAWHSVEGYCKIGTYEGNNSVAGGTFVNCGFRPALVIFKNIDSTGSWVMYDSNRNYFNPVDTRLTANSQNSYGTSSSMEVDFMSNGFKLRNQDADLNTSNTYVYAAWAENPLGGAGAKPVTAR